MMDHLLTTILSIPFFGAAAILFVPAQNTRAHRTLGVVTATVTLALSVFLFAQFDRANGGFQFADKHAWVPALGISYHVAVDGISLTLVMLTTIVGFASTLIAREIQTRQKEFYLLLMLMLGGILGAFVSLDIFFLYFFHELALIPAFLMVGIWGNSTKADKTYAAMKLTIYLSIGAFIALLGLIALYVKGGVQSFDLLALQQAKFTEGTQGKIFPLLLFGFGILVSLWPFHTWAPLGYGAAPTATAMMHAGVLKKFGLYALIRIALPLLPEGATQPQQWDLPLLGLISFTWINVMVWLCLFNILYVGMATLAQRDLNYIIGYSSVMHMGYAFLGIASLSLIGLTGAILLMFAHGIAAALAFALVGQVTAQTGTRDLDEMGGLAKRMPFLATAFTMAALAACGLPGFANFASEILIFFGAWQKYPWATVAAVWGVVISAVYMLCATRDVFFGPMNPRFASLSDARGASEKLPLVFLIVVLIGVGCWPRLLTDIIESSMKPIAAKFEMAKPNVEIVRHK